MKEMEIEREETQETFPFSVHAFPRLHRRARSDVARVVLAARSARWTAPRDDHGNSDKSWEHSRPEFQPLQSSGLMDAPTITSAGCSPREMARYGFRGRRVGEASHPCPTCSEGCVLVGELGCTGPAVEMIPRRREFCPSSLPQSFVFLNARCQAVFF